MTVEVEPKIEQLQKEPAELRSNAFVYILCDDKSSIIGVFDSPDIDRYIKEYLLPPPHDESLELIDYEDVRDSDIEWIKTFKHKEDATRLTLIRLEINTL